VTDRYRLGPLRDARARDERVRRGDLAAATGDAAAHEAVAEAAAAAVAAARAAVTAAITGRDGCAEAGRRALADRYVARRRRDLAAARDAHARALAARDAQQGEVDAARSRLVAARAEREVVERHFARWREARRKAAERRED
jgi:hypothetical protein